MKKIIIFPLIVLLFFLNTKAQLSYGGKPFSFKYNLKSAVPVEHIPGVNIKKLLAEDSITDQYKDIPWRFGYAISVNYSLKNSGIWEDLKAKKGKIWRLTIQAKGAKSINLNFSKFNIPHNAKLFIYNMDKTVVLGAFTEKNHNPDGKFATSIIPGDQITLEYFEPYNARFNGEIVISDVVYGYRTIRNYLNKNFGDAGTCNIDVNCPNGALWQNEKRAVVMILTSNNTRICSGALVNNVREDGTPYILTANHCSPATNSIFMFNYESPQCTPVQDGPTNFTIQGATIRANDSPSDFFLLELNSLPPDSFNVFYAGWDARDIPALSATCIHHPQGDVKKISHELDTLVSSGFFGAGNDHWMVTDWDTGTTEPGSSGSPLFNQDHRIVGQLHGGNAACGNNLEDYFGKFSYSWDSDPTPSKQLKYWLDPDNTGTMYIDGYDPQVINFALDAQLLSITGINSIQCSDSIYPIITIKNKGTDTIFTLNIYYGLDTASLNLYSFNDTLITNATAQINLPPLNINQQVYTFLAFCNSPNGNQDQNTSNDSMQITFTGNPNPSYAVLILNTDDWGSETTWQITDTLNNVLYTGGPYSDVQGGSTIIDTFCLSKVSCYTFTIFDSYGDGMNGSQWGGVDGSYYILNEFGDTVISIKNVNFGNREDNPFCTIKCTLNANINTTPTMCDSATGTASVVIISGNAPFSYLWSTTDTTDSISGLSYGYYSVTITDSLFYCSINKTFFIDNIDSININYSKNDITCNGYNDGNITANATGGLPPYDYLWINTGDSTSFIDSLSPGNYILMVTDSSGCKELDTITIVEPLPISLTSSVTNASTVTSNDGAIDLTVSGGTPPYTYYWWTSFGFTDSIQDLDSISTGNYSVLVTDSNGCVDSLIDIYVGFGTSVQSLNSNNEFIKIYPNPADNFFVIDLNNYYYTKNIYLEVYSPLGQLVFKKNIITPKTIINTSKIKKGFYFIYLESQNNNYIDKIFIIH